MVTYVVAIISSPSLWFTFEFLVKHFLCKLFKCITSIDFLFGFFSITFMLIKSLLLLEVHAFFTYISSKNLNSSSLYTMLVSLGFCN